MSIAVPCIRKSWCVILAHCQSKIPGTLRLDLLLKFLNTNSQKLVRNLLQMKLKVTTNWLMEWLGIGQISLMKAEQMSKYDEIRGERFM